MSTVELVSLGAATAALVAVVGVGLALVRTRRCIEQLRLTVDRLQSAPAEPVESPSEQPLPAPLSETVARADQQRVVSVTMAPPLERVAALSYGLARALRAENRDRVTALMRRDLRRRRKLRQQAARRAARTAMTSPGSQPGTPS